MTCFGFLFGAAEMIALAGLTHIPSLAASLTAAGLDTFASIPFFTGYTLANLPIVLFIYIGVTGIGFTCYFLAMEVTSAQTTSLVFFFKPALAPLLAFLVLHEAIPGNMLAGIACILCGSLVSILPGSARAAKERAPGHGRRDQRKNRSLNPQSLRPQRSLPGAFLHLLHKIRLDIPHMLCYCLNRLIQ